MFLLDIFELVQILEENSIELYRVRSSYSFTPKTAQ